jgi:hypothetical protein
MREREAGQMRGTGLAAFWPAMVFLTWAWGGESRPDSSHTVHTFDAQGREHLPPERF